MQFKKAFLYIFFLIFELVYGCSVTSSNHSQKPLEDNFMKNEEGKSIVKMGVTLQSSFGENIQEDSIAYYDRNCVITQRSSSIHTVMIDPHFNPENLPKALRLKYNEAEVLVLNLPFINYANEDLQTYPLPSFLNEFSKVKYFVSNNYILDNSLIDAFGNSMSHLFLQDTLAINLQFIYDHLHEVNNLKYLVINNELSTKEVSKLNERFPQIIIISDSDFNKKIKNGEISMP